MKKSLFLWFLLIQISFGQELKPVTTIPLVADTFVGIDSYKNLYYTKDMGLYKTGPDGNYRYNDFQLGPIASVDIINPLKVVVFYENTNVVVFLDNRLNEIEQLNFNTLQDFINVSHASNAGNNRLWLFNVDSQQLELYNYRTGRRTTISQPIIETLVAQVSNFNYCYLLTTTRLLTFNIYGSLLSEADAGGIEKIVQQNENLLGVEGDRLLYILAPETGAEKTIQQLKYPSPQNPIKDLQLTQDFLYIYDGKTVHTYSLTQPKQ